MLRQNKNTAIVSLWQKSLRIAVRRLCRNWLALSVTFGDTSPKGRGLGSPRKVNGFARGSPTRGAVTEGD